MSGGAYNYIGSKDPKELFDHKEELESIAHELEEIGEDEAGQAIYMILHEMAQFEAKIDKVWTPYNGRYSSQPDLSAIADALEYWHSGDTGEDLVHEVCAKWKEQK